jgi:uncharacterized protein YecT (DUF1311 family)
MKKFKIIVLLYIITFPAFSQIQVDSNNDAEDSFKKADNELNRVYQTILHEYKDDTLFMKNLKSVQRLWIQFRNAEVRMKYPDTINGRYSTPYLMCTFSYKEKITRERINALKVWLEGIKGYSECAGTLKVKQ